MNIIALMDLIPVDKTRITSLEKADFTQIKKVLVELQETNPEILDADITQLLKALKSHPEAFQAVMNDRTLFNFFANKNLARKQFVSDANPVETEKIKAFVKLFFGEELNAILIESVEANKFNDISILAEAHNHFPDNLTFAIRQHLLDKLDDAINAIEPPYGNFSKILYIKDAHFFALLNNIKDDEIEQKISELFDAVLKFHNQDSNSELANKTFLAMNSYNPIDTEFSKRIKSKKELADTKFDAHKLKRRNLTWVYVLVGFVVFVRVVYFFATFKSNNDFDTYDDVTYDEEIYEEPPRTIDKYYTNMKYSIDSFQVFLTSYKDSEIKLLKQDVSLKTGENPFQTFYQNEPTGDSNNFIEVTNNTGYDMVLLENAVLYDSIKMPRSAHFIKAGDRLEVNFNSSYTETIFNVYLGKKWATFQTVANKNLFIRNGSIIEYRFSQLIPAANEILHTDYNLINDAVVSYSNGSLKVNSSGVRINPLSKKE